jgi:hypothetical protein
MRAPQEQFKFKFTRIVDNPYDNKEEDIQTNHHHHCQTQIQSQKPKKTNMVLQVSINIVLATAADAYRKQKKQGKF